jgi:hypothetical protein
LRERAIEHGDLCGAELTGAGGGLWFNERRAGISRHRQEGPIRAARGCHREVVDEASSVLQDQQRIEDTQVAIATHVAGNQLLCRERAKTDKGLQDVDGVQRAHLASADAAFVRLNGPCPGGEAGDGECTGGVGD